MERHGASETTPGVIHMNAPCSKTTLLLCAPLSSRSHVRSRCLLAFPIRNRTLGADDVAPQPPLNKGKLEAAQGFRFSYWNSLKHWFSGPDSWKTAEAIPLLGKYTTNEATVSKHFDQFHQLGIDWLLIRLEQYAVD